MTSAAVSGNPAEALIWVGILVAVMIIVEVIDERQRYYDNRRRDRNRL